MGLFGWWRGEVLYHSGVWQDESKDTIFISIPEQGDLIVQARFMLMAYYLNAHVLANGTPYELSSLAPPPVAAQPNRESGSSSVNRTAQAPVHCRTSTNRLATTKHLPSLPLLRLVVLEWEPTRPLVSTRLPANPAIAAREQNAPERNRSQERRTQRAEAE
jgi:hypothetical protein